MKIHAKCESENALENENAPGSPGRFGIKARTNPFAPVEADYSRPAKSSLITSLLASHAWFKHGKRKPASMDFNNEKCV